MFLKISQNTNKSVHYTFPSLTVLVQNVAPNLAYFLETFRFISKNLQMPDIRF